MSRDAMERVKRLREALPPQGLFAGKTWRFSPEPFALPRKFVAQLEFLGRVLLRFYKAANLLYLKSSRGEAPEWAARWLDMGKPPRVIELGRRGAWRQEVPRVIRPDLILTEDGFRITELDSIPGGIGLTDWLHQAYAELDPSFASRLAGGRHGMREGFAGIFGDAPRVHIVVSEESAAYRPEMLWLAEQADPERFRLASPKRIELRPGEAVYRFFELFDLSHVPAAEPLFQSAARGEIWLTPPPKAFLEEKALLGLFWNRNLRSFWRREMGARFFEELRERTPRTWILDPSPLPPHAAIPELELTDWRQLKALSKKERNLILKESGFSPEAWGTRSVTLGSDCSAEAWAEAVDRALHAWPQRLYVLQRYHKPRRIPFRWADEKGLFEEEGRVRLCPYYFAEPGPEPKRVRLGGVLATICPADKKIIHGMREAVMAPCMTEA